MRLFQYIDVVRTLDNKLRSWKSYDVLSKYEEDMNFNRGSPRHQDQAEAIKYREKRSRFQKRVQKVS